MLIKNYEVKAEKNELKLILLTKCQIDYHITGYFLAKKF